MVFLTKMIDRKFTDLQDMFIAGYGFFVPRNVHTDNHILQTVAYYARDRVPLCSYLQILSVPVSRSCGSRSSNDQIIWRYEWDSLQQS